MTPAFDAINPLPDGDELELVHERAYIVRAYRKAADLLVLRGARPRPEAAGPVHRRTTPSR